MKKCNRLTALISSAFIMMSVPAYGDDPLSSEELEEYITDNAQAIVDAGEDRAALQRQFDNKLGLLQKEKQQLEATVDKLVTQLEQLTQALEQSTKQVTETDNKQNQVADQLSRRLTNVENRQTTNQLSKRMTEVEAVEYRNRTIPGNIFRDRLDDGTLGPQMVVIPAGTFRMGDTQGIGLSNAKVHSVSINRFAMGRYEVTFAEYDKFAEATGREKPSDNGYGRGNRPVINVQWDDATAYADWLTLRTGHQYRLPTEAEWEYAARAGTETNYWWGNDINYNYGNYGRKESYKNFCNKKCTTPVGSFRANQFGLFDTAGNVWELTCSQYREQYVGQEQRCANTAFYSGNNLYKFALRGGSWFNNSKWEVATAFRRHNYSYVMGDIGFRLASPY